MYEKLLYFLAVLTVAFTNQIKRPRYGHDVILSDEEKTVNALLMKHKVLEFKEMYKDDDVYTPTKYVFDAFEAIDVSMVFQFIKFMPKGGLLNGHFTSLLSLDGLYKLTYEDNLYGCFIDDKVKLKFMSKPTTDEECKWYSIRYIRERDPTFDDWFVHHLTLLTLNPKSALNDTDTVLQRLEDIYETVYPMLTYRPVMQTYLYQALMELYDDKVSYLEIRAEIHTLYELDGQIYEPVEVAAIYLQVIEEFKRRQPFIDVKLICVIKNTNDINSLEQHYKILKKLQKNYPGFLVGFDIVGLEETDQRLRDVVAYFQNLSISFVCHSDDNTLKNTKDGLNLFDVIWLGGKRIGRGGYELIKRPGFFSLAKGKNIAIEVSPISNQVTMMIDNMRKHPAKHLISEDFPIVVTSDGSSCWGTKGLSYDFFVFFMGVSNRRSDLRLLKKLAENSITYSAMTENDKTLALEKWRQEWDNFISVMSKKASKFEN